MSIENNNLHSSYIHCASVWTERLSHNVDFIQQEGKLRILNILAEAVPSAFVGVAWSTDLEVLISNKHCRPIQADKLIIPPFAVS